MITAAWCVSRSCTSGWLDWIHGDLWLLPDGLIRRRLSLAETRAHKPGRPTVGYPLPSADPAAFPRAAVLAEHRTNRVIEFGAVAQARLVHGWTADALRLTMTDGSRPRLLWLTTDPAYRIFAEVLPGMLGSRFTA